MNRDWRIVWLVVGGLACLDWAAKLWLFSAFLGTTGAPTTAALTSAAAPPLPLPMQRISEDGVHYGHCAGVTLAVVLFPEPCGWDGATPDQMSARR
jgi:hypothetical protein